ncbi:hypothetical protein [Paracoccus sp. 22332]|uniref:hypothetical protein n=1 Tax=Paracoccus sp. 22332 TaxID=3453913 RepID=UPI003F856D34
MFKPLLAALLMALPLGAAAAPVAAPVIDVPQASGYFLAHEGTGDFLAFDALAVVDGVATGDSLLADLSLTFDLADPYADASGAFSLRDEGGWLVDGVLDRVSASDGVLSLVFGDLTGSIAGLFGDSLTVSLAFLSLPDSDPLRALRDGETYDIAYWAEGASQPAPVPLPAGALLLVSGLGMLVLRRSRRATA